MVRGEVGEEIDEQSAQEICIDVWRHTSSRSVLKLFSFNCKAF